MAPSFVAVLLLSHLIVLIHGAQNTVNIPTQLGDIKGTTVSTDPGNETVYIFKGIPYAEPPVGDLRFRPSVLKTLKWNGTRDGTKAGAQCLQPNVFADRAEDCLFLNVFTTKSIVENAKNKLVPVMVCRLMIHSIFRMPSYSLSLSLSVSI